MKQAGEAAQLLHDLREIVDTVRSDYRLREKRSGAPITVLRALTAIAANPGSTSSALATNLRIERSTASNLLREIEALGLVSRRRLDSDQRYVLLELTPAGLELARKSRRTGQGLLSRAVEQLAAAELQRLHRALAPLLAAIRSGAAARRRRSDV
jgi:DNA-binding MarR family transcriptional regulator